MSGIFLGIYTPVVFYPRSCLESSIILHRRLIIYIIGLICKIADHGILFYAWCNNTPVHPAHAFIATQNSEYTMLNLLQNIGFSIGNMNFYKPVGLIYRGCIVFRPELFPG